MKISTRSRYGLRLLLELAKHTEGAPLFLSEIARTQQVSEKYLSKLVIALRSAGLIKSVRGSKGGYLLARPAESISLMEIISCLEGDFKFIDCTVCPEKCGRSSSCVARVAWLGLEEAMSGYCRQTSLAAIRDNAAMVPVN